MAPGMHHAVVPCYDGCAARTHREQGGTVTGVPQVVSDTEKAGRKEVRCVSEPELLLSLECNEGVLTTRNWVN